MWSANTMPINTTLIKKHLYELHNYKVPTFCDCCNHLLVGARKQGIRCKRCLINVHEKCQEDASPCIEVIQGRHNFQHHNYKKPQNCDYCKKLLGGLLRQGLQCSECGANVHERCQESINLTCTGGESTEKTKSDTYDRNRNQEYNEQANTNTANEKTSLQQIDNKRYGYDASREGMSPIFETMPSMTTSESSGHSPSQSSSPVAMKKAIDKQKSPLTSTGALQSQVDEVVSVLKDNADALGQREAKLNTLQESASSLEKNANALQTISRELKRKYWYQNNKLTIGIAVVVLLLIIAIIVVVVVKMQMSKSRKKVT